MSAEVNFFLISLPYRTGTEQQRLAQFQQLRASLSTLAPVAREFQLPHLKVGTLDSLIEASDDLAKIDPLLEGAAFRLASILEDITGQPRASVAVVRVATHTNDASWEMFIKDFAWNTALYDIKEPLNVLIRKFQLVVQGAEERTRTQLVEFAESKTKLTQAQRKFTGNLSLKPIKAEVDAWCAKIGIPQPWETEHLTTLFVAVQVDQMERWEQTYWTFGEMVAPRCSVVVAQDKEFVLVTLVTFKKAKYLDEVKSAIRKNRFVLREYQAADDLSVEDYDKLRAKVGQDKEKMHVLVAQQFSACYTAWIHAKAVRLFVESLLKYGIPPKFLPILLAVDDQKEQEIRARLNALYKDYASPFPSDLGSHDTGALQHDFPYVSLKVANILKAR